jgi:hypothetical protein
LYQAGGTTSLASATPGGCSPAAAGAACAALALTVSPNQEITLVVRADLKADKDGATSGETVALALPASGSPSPVKAYGVGSQENLVLSNGDSTAEGEIFIGRNTPGANVAITGPTHDVTLAKLNSIENSSPDSDGALLLLGTQRLGQFRFIAASNENTAGGRNDVTLQRLQFIVSASNTTLDIGSFVLRDPNLPSATSDCIASGDTGSITVTCDNLDVGIIDARVGSGQAKDLELRGNITAFPSSGSSRLTTTLNQLSDRNTTGTIQWSDGDTTFDWVDLPVTQVRSTAYER